MHVVGKNNWQISALRCTAFRAARYRADGNENGGQRCGIAGIATGPLSAIGHVVNYQAAKAQSRPRCVAPRQLREALLDQRLSLPAASRAQQPARRPRFDRARRFKCEGLLGVWSRQTSVCGAAAWIRTAFLTSRLIRNEAQAFAQGVVYVRLHEQRQGSGRTPACCCSPRPYRKVDLAKMIRAALAVRRRPISLRRGEMSCDRSVTARHSRRPTRIYSNDNVFVSSSTE